MSLDYLTVLPDCYLSFYSIKCMILSVQGFSWLTVGMGCWWESNKDDCVVHSQGRRKEARGEMCLPQLLYKLLLFNKILR